MALALACSATTLVDFLFPLDVSEAPYPFSTRPNLIRGRDGNTTLLQALEETRGPTVVIEPGRMRVLTDTRARLFWRNWYDRRQDRENR